MRKFHAVERGLFSRTILTNVATVRKMASINTFSGVSHQNETTSDFRGEMRKLVILLENCRRYVGGKAVKNLFSVACLIGNVTP